MEHDQGQAGEGGVTVLPADDSCKGRRRNELGSDSFVHDATGKDGSGPMAFRSNPESEKKYHQVFKQLASWPEAMEALAQKEASYKDVEATSDLLKEWGWLQVYERSRRAAMRWAERWRHGIQPDQRQRYAEATRSKLQRKTGDLQLRE